MKNCLFCLALLYVALFLMSQHVKRKENQIGVCLFSSDAMIGRFWVFARDVSGAREE
jgi:hypothetical protein